MHLSDRAYVRLFSTRWQRSKIDNHFVASWCHGRVVLFRCYIVEIANYGNLAMDNIVTLCMNYFDILILTN